MKRLIITIATILVLLFSISSLCACSKIPENYRETRSNLRQNGYDVLAGATPKEAVDLSVEILYGLVNSFDEEYCSIEEGEILLSCFEEDYTALVKDIDYCVAGLSENGEGSDILLVIYFDDSKSLENHYDTFVDIFDLIRFSILDIDYTPIDSDDLIYHKTKNILYFGTEQAIKDAN